MVSQFSSDGKYFGLLSTEGKLNVWNTSTSKLEQQFIPDLHLTCPLTCLHFLESARFQIKDVSPKRKRRNSNQHNTQYLVLGTNTGLLLGYSITNAAVTFSIDSNTKKSITCLSWYNGPMMYAGVDQSIYIINLQEQNISDKWKAGNETVNAIKAIPGGKLLTANKSIKLWNVKTKEVLRSYTGHSSDVCIIEYIKLEHNSLGYFITGSKGDRLLSCWTLNESSEDPNAVATFLMDDVAIAVTIFQLADGTTNFGALTRGGIVYFYQHSLNGKCKGPLKPKTVLQIVSDSAENHQEVTPVPILGVVFHDTLAVTICYGSHIHLIFENVTMKFNEKVQCLIRSTKIQKTKEAQSANKVRQPIVGNHVQFSTPYDVPSRSVVKRKADGKCEVPMEQRLENLMLTKSDSKVPQPTNLSQLLIQGIHSKDKNILRTVLTQQDDAIIRSTIKRLPIAAIVPLLQELTEFVQGKTHSCSIAVLWIKHILRIHSAILLSNPQLPDLFTPIMRGIESRLLLQTSLSKLHGRLDLLMSQVNSKNSPGEDNEDDPVLSYIDKDSSDSEVEDMNVGNPHSDNEWSEEESESENQKNNVSMSESEGNMST